MPNGSHQQLGQHTRCNILPHAVAPVCAKPTVDTDACLIDAAFVVLSRGELERGQLGNFERRSLDDMESFAISQPGLNFSKTEAILYIDYSCFRVTDLCSGGYFILMRKVNGVWSVVDQFSAWVS